jgi:3-hydroxymyristoyl/3-hydroxydecanoyl-(acyl carrier protein) dehydratase
MDNIPHADGIGSGLSGADRVFICFNRQGLETILPHRGEALRKIDAVFYDPDDPNRLIGIKEVRSDDRDLEGHFPGAPTYPGYAQDEFVCLVAAALIPLSVEGLKAGPQVVQKAVRYKKRVQPGDRLVADVRLESRRGRFLMYSGEIRSQNNDLIAVYEKIVGAV